MADRHWFLERAEAVAEHRCVICGGFIATRGVPVWTQPLGQGSSPMPVQWEQAHVECSMLLIDDQEEEEGSG